ncbi:MAG TPA: acylphosphatase [Stellaceae bacterium]|nr:acylphosphatase [Stellaceae bacterium]
MGETACRIVITGRVQGVGFRAWARAEAVRRNIRGWVRNRRDGTVEALLIAPGDRIDAMIEACREGPSLARVTAIAREPAPDDGSADFEERPTV